MVESEWARCRAWLVRALDDATEDEALALLRAGTAQLWPGERAAFVTYCQKVDERRELHVWLAGGHIHDLLAMIPGIAAWGRSMDCTHATVNGRRGWARVLARYGFEECGGQLRKAL